jgi:hypothetical protein
MRAPLKQFCKQENISERFAYAEKERGRLRFTYVGNRVFIDDQDAEAWRALAPKATGGTGVNSLQGANILRSGAKASTARKCCRFRHRRPESCVEKAC